MFSLLIQSHANRCLLCVQFLCKTIKWIFQSLHTHEKKLLWLTMTKLCYSIRFLCQKKQHTTTLIHNTLSCYAKVNLFTFCVSLSLFESRWPSHGNYVVQLCVTYVVARIVSMWASVLKQLSEYYYWYLAGILKKMTERALIPITNDSPLMKS